MEQLEGPGQGGSGADGELDLGLSEFETPMRHPHGVALCPVGFVGLDLERNPLWERRSGVVGIETDKSVGAGQAQGCMWHVKRECQGQNSEDPFT